MLGLSYHSRLKALNLENLELRRLRADLLLLFGLLRVFTRSKPNNIFHSKTPVTITRSRMLHKQRCFSSNRRNFCSIRIVSMWEQLARRNHGLLRIRQI